MTDALRAYAIMLKPVGSACNLRCEYCYYLDKGKLLHQQLPRMCVETLESAVRQIIDMHGRDATVEFAWHGGEPALAGIPFFDKALALERKYGANRRILNTIQTNGGAMTDEWALFLKENRFLVGVSVDGPEELHNRYRRDAKGIGSYAGAMNAVELFKRYGVPFNVLCTVNAANENRGREVYAFLRTLSDYLQFLPVVECLPTVYEKEEGHRFALPPGRYSPRIAHPVTDFSVSPKGYGRFLCDVLAAWRELGDPGRVQVQQINAALALKEGKPCGLCTHEAVCGHGAVIETDGDVFRCDRYVFPRYRLGNLLGNLLETGLQEMMEQNRDFGMHKTCSLPESCLTCPYVRLCFGGCPKDRFLADDQGRPGKNYLCEGYRQFFGCL